MKKKLIIIIVVCIAALAIIAGSVFLLFSVFGGSEKSVPTITVESVTGSVGEKVKVPVSIKGNPGIMGSKLEITYDSKALKYVTYDKGNVFSDYSFADYNGKLIYVGLEEENINKNGTLFYIEFEILDGAKGKTEIDINLDGSDFANFEEELIDLKVKKGSVTIE